MQEHLLEALRSNPNIREDKNISLNDMEYFLKEAISVLSEVFPNYNYRPYVLELLKNFDVSLSSRLFDKQPSEYKPVDNVIKMSIDTGFDTKELYVKGLIELLTSKQKESIYKGFDGRLEYDGINNAYTAFLTSKCGGDFKKSIIDPYEDEVIFLQQLACIVGSDVINASFEMGSFDLVEVKLNELGVTSNEIKVLLNLISNHYHTRSNGMSSNVFGVVQMKMIDIFSRKPDISKEDMANFESALYFEPSYFKDSSSYSDIKEQKKYFEVLMNNKKLEKGRSL